MGEDNQGNSIWNDDNPDTFYQECVVKKKKEFNTHLCSSSLMPIMSSSSEDSWLLSRLSPNSGCKEEARKKGVAEIDTDSGLESTQEEHADTEKLISVGDDVHSDEMKEMRLNLRARNCKIVGAARPKIPHRLCKVTKV